MVIFENWIEKPFPKANHKPKSAINLADIYWQGMDSLFPLNDYKIVSIIRFDLTILLNSYHMKLLS